MSNITRLIHNNNINSLGLSESQLRKAQKFLDNDQRNEVLVLFNGKLKVMKAKSGKPLDYRIANMALSVFSQSAMDCKEIQEASRLHFNRKRLSYTTQSGETKNESWDSKFFSISNTTNTLIVQAEIAGELHYLKQIPQDINSAFTEIKEKENATLSAETKNALQSTYHTDFSAERSDKLSLCKLVQNQLLNQLKDENPALFNLVSFSLDALDKDNLQTLLQLEDPSRFIEWMQIFLGKTTISNGQRRESVLKITDVTNRIFDQLKNSKNREHSETSTIQSVRTANNSSTSLSTHKAPPPPPPPPLSTTNAPTTPPVPPPSGSQPASSPAPLTTSSKPNDTSSKKLEPATAMATVANTSTLSSNTSTLHSTLPSSPKTDENDNPSNDSDSITLASLVDSSVSSGVTETLSSTVEVSISSPTYENPPRQSKEVKQLEQLKQEINNLLENQYTSRKLKNREKKKLHKTINKYAEKARNLGVDLDSKNLSIESSPQDPPLPLKYIVRRLTQSLITKHPARANTPGIVRSCKNV